MTGLRGGASGQSHSMIRPGERPDGAQTLERLDLTTSGNPLVNLVQAKEAAPGDALRLGLLALVALADLARTDADSPAGQ